ncbi:MULTISPECIES: phage adaptor protein [unclassified Pseudoalteromonas]|uniref:phage adaptor protein n=1 Tax=unclassified Pseudoalteromonas TaxID=194690 RepID=UPI00202B43B8|nr:DUF6682 family protein [Pseudoalteromonas sp. SCSIO 43088]URQ88260.1 hypothetical protein J8Z28_20455 [Pseudoalteromonas sp. SCSIO 43088]
MLTVGTILTNRVRVLLRDIDEGGVQWRDPELIQWFNEACAEIARVRPESCSSTESFALAAGSKQSVVSTGASRVLEVICNLVDGEEGRAVRRVERSTLDNEDPDWMAGTKTKTVFRYSASLTDPRSFFVYPPSDGTGSLLMVIGTTPDEVVELTDAFPLPSMYAACVANYVLFRAFAKFTESEAMQTRASGYYNLFTSQISDTQSSMEQDNAVTRDRNGAK